MADLFHHKVGLAAPATATSNAANSGTREEEEGQQDSYDGASHLSIVLAQDTPRQLLHAAIAVNARQRRGPLGHERAVAEQLVAVIDPHGRGTYMAVRSVRSSYRAGLR